jgi:predicted thioesterase
MTDDEDRNGYAALVGEVRGRREFTVTSSHATTVFGRHEDPPARPAAGDAAPEEAVEVFGTPALVAWVEFVARDALHGRLPDGKGCAGEVVEARHRRAAPVGEELVVETELVGAEGSQLTSEGTVSRARDGAVVGTVKTVFRVVDRVAFRASLEP